MARPVMTELYVEREDTVAKAVTLFPRDTVVRALSLMQRYGLSRLPVVDDVHGELIGDVTADDLTRVWQHAPLACMSEILSLKSLRVEDLEDTTRWGPRLTLVSPLVDVYQTSKRWVQ
ncbi:CBS domain-containing protein [Myxococcus xanthus]|uniref:CBS domain-containing protein n=2 Tax=Myxococcus xanthus TaxID=34 RepID=A0A7Y4IES3_MYXXA|nr:CBS domain-containing protein [Myxococcus xanthus]NOJ86626.1 CBS domain-containing protein [Myxococcus xanthus]